MITVKCICRGTLKWDKENHLGHLPRKLYGAYSIPSHCVIYLLVLSKGTDIYTARSTQIFCASWSFTSEIKCSLSRRGKFQTAFLGYNRVICLLSHLLSWKNSWTASLKPNEHFSTHGWALSVVRTVFPICRSTHGCGSAVTDTSCPRMCMDTFQYLLFLIPFHNSKRIYIWVKNTRGCRLGGKVNFYHPSVWEEK